MMAIKNVNASWGKEGGRGWSSINLEGGPRTAREVKLSIDLVNVIP